MVKFTYLYSRILSMKPKKTIETSLGTMHKTPEDCSQNEAKSSQGDFFDDPCSKSEGNNSNYSGVPHTRKIRKSISLGSGLGREGRASNESDSENEKRENERRVNYHETITPEGVEHLAIHAANQSQEALAFELTNNESVFSIGDTPQLSKYGHEISNSQFSSPLMVKSKSLTNICSPAQIVASHSRSVEDLTAFDVNKTEMDSNVSNKEENVDVNDRHFLGEFSSDCFENMPSKDYKMKRIEDWVFDLQHFTPLEEINDEFVNLDNIQLLGGDSLVDGTISSKINDNLNLGVEVATRCISSLSPSATTAHLANHGLVIVPFLSAFVSLRTVNISGNFIVKITAGALPRGLHVLNLSKNSITVVEGLRELTRLRILDLSYNRIVRIGHGLASCSSLKELYLSGNKISEIEGLHRLLKLNTLDLRFNKISTTKSLGQLAANYNSLQAISLEGNPAQKHIGDENLKKHLHGLLPHLSYYNRHTIKTKALINGSDRSARCKTSNRGLRSDHKGSHNKSVSSSRNHSVLLPKTLKDKGVRLPPTGNKVLVPHRNHYYNYENKILGFGFDSLMRRSRSEGTLGVL